MTKPVAEGMNFSARAVKGFIPPKAATMEAAPKETKMVLKPIKAMPIKAATPSRIPMRLSIISLLFFLTFCCLAALRQAQRRIQAPKQVYSIRSGEHWTRHSLQNSPHPPGDFFGHNIPSFP